MPFSRPAPLALLACLAVSPLAALAADPAAEAWPLAARFDFNAARGVLAAASADQPGAPADLRLAHAAALLGAQPRVPDNIRIALATTRAVAADSTTPADTRLIARHLEGRILREHIEPRTRENLAASREIFREVLAADSAHPVVARSALPLAFGLLYDEPESASPAARLAAAEALLPSVAAHPAVERDLRYVLSQAALVWGLDPAIARDHLKRVDEIGFTQRPRRLHARVTLGLLAEETGQLELAASAYRGFLAESVRDAREDTVRAALASVETRLAR